jgi:HNH endonuclease
VKAAGNPWMKFYPSDWRADPALRSCTIAARGLWVEMLCIMHEATPYGSLLINGARVDKKRLAALAGIMERECTVLLLELEGFGVFSRDDDGTIYSRRMRRDYEKALEDKRNGGKGGAPNVRRGAVPKADRVARTYRKSDSLEKTARIFAKTGGQCFWCDIALVKDPANESEYPDFFHVDHLVPVCDGGDNDEDNLVPACAICNHDRSKLGWPENSRRKVDPTRTRRSDPTLTPDTNPGTKAQKPYSEIDRIGSAGAFTEGSKALATAFWKALGFNSPLAIPPEFAGIDWRALEWERAGWTADLIDTEARKIGPAKPLSYHEKCFATAFAKRQAPLPIVEIKQAETLTVKHGKPENGITKAIKNLNRTIASFDGPPGEADDLCGSEGGTPTRLLSNG